MPAYLVDCRRCRCRRRRCHWPSVASSSCCSRTHIWNLVDLSKGQNLFSASGSDRTEPEHSVSICSSLPRSLMVNFALWYSCHHGNNSSQSRLIKQQRRKVHKTMHPISWWTCMTWLSSRQRIRASWMRWLVVWCGDYRTVPFAGHTRRSWRFYRMFETFLPCRRLQKWPKRWDEP